MGEPDDTNPASPASKRAAREFQPFSMPSPFPPGSLAPRSVAPAPRPSVYQRAKRPTLWVVLGIVLGEALNVFLTSRGVAPAVGAAARRAVEQAAEHAGE